MACNGRLGASRCPGSSGTVRAMDAQVGSGSVAGLT